MEEPEATPAGSLVPQVSGPPPEEEELNELVSPFFEYLKTPHGHEVATRVLNIFDDLKKAALNHTASQVKLERLLQIVIVIMVVLAASTLAVMDKFNATVGVLFGTLIGYIFGKKAP